jgi:hypothetical protein
MSAEDHGETGWREPADEVEHRVAAWRRVGCTEIFALGTVVDHGTL